MGNLEIFGQSIVEKTEQLIHFGYVSASTTMISPSGYFTFALLFFGMIFAFLFIKYLFTTFINVRNV